MRASVRIAIVCAVLTAVLPAGVRAQIRFPEIAIKDKVEKPIVLQEVHVSADIAGTFALTTVEMVFFNPNGRVLEGDLKFPLLDGQSVTRFAMDVNGTLREAVPIEKPRGQEIYEDVVRRGIDPGLLEKTEGNNYHVRVYPLPARGSKRVIVGVTEALNPASGKAVYRLPLSFPEKLGKFSLRISVPGIGTKPIVQSSVPGLELPPWSESFNTSIEKNDFKADGLLEVALPLERQSRTSTERIGDKTYFYSEVAIPVETSERPQPRTVGLLWDSSGSGARRNHDREFDILDKFFKKYPTVEVRLVRLRNEAEPALTFRVNSGDWAALRSELVRTAYDGGTTLGSFAVDPDVDEYVLFSDGLDNFGAHSFPELGRPLFAVVSSSSADVPYLRWLSSNSGGAYADLLSLSSDEALAQLTTSHREIVGVDSNPAEVAHVFTRPVAPQQGIYAVAGVLRAPEARVTLRVGKSKRGEPTDSVDLHIAADENKGAVAGKGWALLKIGSLEPKYEENREDILRTGREFGIVTRGTSLLILDSVDDYVRYDVAPPENLRAEFDAVSARVRAERVKTDADHLQRVVELFGQKVAWWNKDFPKDMPKDVAGDGRMQREAAGVDDEGELREDRAEIDADQLEPAPQAFAGAAAPAADDANSSVAKPKGGKAESDREVSVTLKKWTPDAAYLEHFRRAEPDKLYQAYLEERPDNERSSAFFLDSADFFMDKGQPELGLRVLSNIAEMDLENYQLLRILGNRLVQIGQSELALPVFEKVLALRPNEPQSYRDLGLACAAAKQYQRAVDLLWEVVSRDWHGRFPEIELIALGELNAIAAAHADVVNVGRVDPRLRKNLPVDLRVTLSWDADNTDIDLWVTDPNGQKCMYNFPLTYQGGRMSRDFTQGYGPEEFLLRVAKPGKYIVEANYYGNHQQVIAGATTIQMTLSSKFGTAEQQDQTVTLRLKDNKEVVKVGEFDVR